MDNTSEHLRAVAVEWQIDHKLTGVTTDNARNIIRAVQLLSWQHVPCFGHTLQLAVKMGLELPLIVAVLVRCRKIVGHFKHSVVETELLKKEREAMGISQRKLVQEVNTRWNSTFYMLERLLEQEAAVSAVLVKDRKFRHLVLDPNDLFIMQHVATVLKPLAQATEMLCEEKQPSISVILPTLVALLKKHLATANSEPEVVTSFKVAISQKLAAHFTDPDLRHFLLMASFLDPRFKLLKFISSSERADVYSHVQTVVTDMVTAQEENEDPVPSAKHLRTMADTFDYTESSDSSSSSPHCGPVDDAEREISLFRAAEHIERNEDPLEWWRLNSHRFKTLSQLAHKVLCIQATSTPSERLCSSAGTVVQQKRAALSPKTVDCLLFLHKNMQ